MNNDTTNRPLAGSECPLALSRLAAPLVQASRLVYAGSVVQLRVDEVVLPQGRTATREVVEHPGAVVIAAVDEAEEIYLVRQYRYAAGCALLELPAGTLESGEEPLHAAQRELREEAGITASEWTSLGHFYSSPGFANEKLHAFLARGLCMVEADPDDDEDLVLEKYPLASLLRHPRTIVDGKTLATLLLVQEHLA